ncbi:NADH dehydrogenase (ubiquinone) complex I, assembly factor 6 homolog isoform X2 [Anopheles darlingi]|nr:NADH dehydrogenase (ubiquinone) complex I, assembly factor 6 homolog isoform X2 [Anopheles darlingi]
MSRIVNMQTICVRRIVVRLKQQNAVQMSSSSGAAAQNMCLDLVRRHDKENFLCTLLLKNPERRSAFAVRAFNVEVAKVSEKVSSSSIGVMPLKFWDDTIAGLYRKNGSKVPEHPVIEELASAINRHRLSKMHFQRLISSRLNTNLHFATVQQLEDYAEHSVSSVLYLLLEVHDTRSVHCDHAASHLGKAQGIVNLLRAIPHQTLRNAVPVPQELLISHGVNQERMVRNAKEDKAVEEVTFQLASIAHRHLQKAKTLLQDSAKVPRKVQPIFYPAVTIERFLDRLRQANFHLSSPSVIRTDALLPLVLYWHNLRGKI